MLVYKEEFRQAFEFLSRYAGRNIPPVKNSSNGLIAAFISMIPFRYGEHVVGLMEDGRCVASLHECFEGTAFHAHLKKVQPELVASMISSEDHNGARLVTFPDALIATLRETGYEKEKLPCFNMILYGSCRKGADCCFSHLADDVRKGFLRWFEILTLRRTAFGLSAMDPKLSDFLPGQNRQTKDARAPLNSAPV